MQNCDPHQFVPEADGTLASAYQRHERVAEEVTHTHSHRYKHESIMHIPRTFIHTLCKSIHSHIMQTMTSIHILHKYWHPSTYYMNNIIPPYYILIQLHRILALFTWFVHIICSHDLFTLSFTCIIYTLFILKEEK